MGFNDWIYVTPAPSAAQTRSSEVNDKLQGKVAQQLEQRLRGRLDQGLADEAARKARSVRATAAEGRIHIDQGDDPAAGLADEERKLPSERRRHARTVDDLFSLGSGYPEVGEGGVVSFRTIDASTLFGRSQEEQDELVDHTVQEVLQLGMVDMFDEAMNEVENEHPSERLYP